MGIEVLIWQSLHATFLVQVPISIQLTSHCWSKPAVDPKLRSPPKDLLGILDQVDSTEMSLHVAMYKTCT